MLVQKAKHRYHPLLEPHPPQCTLHERVKLRMTPRHHSPLTCPLLTRPAAHVLSGGGLPDAFPRREAVVCHGALRRARGAGVPARPRSPTSREISRRVVVGRGLSSSEGCGDERMRTHQAPNSQQEKCRTVFTRIFLPCIQSGRVGNRFFLLASRTCGFGLIWEERCRRGRCDAEPANTARGLFSIVIGFRFPTGQMPAWPGSEGVTEREIFLAGE